MNENNSFISFTNDIHGTILNEENHKKYPLIYKNITYTHHIEDENVSSFIYVYQGSYQLLSEDRPNYILTDGMYASVKGKIILVINEDNSKAIIIEVKHNKGEYIKNKFSSYFTLGGKVEEKGRLKYIDGCTDSLLIAPVKLGDPCLNHLHFPVKIDQTQHTHPSHRIGIVAKGYGECITPFGNLELTKGMIFVIKEWDGKTYAKGLDGKDYPIGQHAFKTTDSTMDVIAFHPDSDFGATDEEHPMINRTIVDGKSAKYIEEIRTK
jgi:hypothetical protein